jgi:hypothetical protein
MLADFSTLIAYTYTAFRLYIGFMQIQLAPAK